MIQEDLIIKMGNNNPKAVLFMKGYEGIESFPTDDMFKGKKTTIFDMPSAFTSKWKTKNLHGFGLQLGKIKSMGNDTVACLADNTSLS